MFLEERVAMNISIKVIQSWLDRHPKSKQWVWFVTLWFAGLGTVVTLTYPIKLLIKNI